VNTRLDRGLVSGFITALVVAGALAIAIDIAAWGGAGILVVVLAKLTLVMRSRVRSLLEGAQRDGYRQCTADVCEMQRLAKQPVRRELRLIDGGRS
jgi:hypothetical protein